MAVISKIKNVHVEKFASAAGDMVYVRVTGEVPTSGWTAPQLMPRNYITPPTDGYWELDFTAAKPMGMVLMVISEVSSETVIPAPNWLKGIRVFGAPPQDADISTELKQLSAA